MTPQEAAELVITCTATGLSGLPLWEYLPGMFVAPAFPESDRSEHPGRIAAVNAHGPGKRNAVHLGICTINGDLVSVRASWMRPDFVDQLTVQALYLLVRRAYHAAGFGLVLIDDGDALSNGIVQLRIVDNSEGRTLRRDGGRAHAVFARALAKAPVRP